MDNPGKRDNVIFTGLISQKEKYEYYDRSRVLVLTSRHESFAFVLVEGVYMKNYVVSTNVGWAEDMQDYVDSVIIPPDDEHIVDKFVSELQRIVDSSDVELNALVPERDIEEITWEYILSHNEGISLLTS